MTANNAQRRGGSLTKWRHMFGWKRMHEGFGEHGGLHGFHVKILLHAAHHTIAELTTCWARWRREIDSSIDDTYCAVMVDNLTIKLVHVCD
jgi:hypothetical protein